MIRVLYYPKDGPLLVDRELAELPAMLGDAAGLIWIDIMDGEIGIVEPILHETLHIHPLAIDDVLHENHVPKLDDWGEYLMLDLHAISYDDSEDGHLDTSELDVILGGNYLVTYHPQPIEACDVLWKACARDERLLKRGADHLMYELADLLVDSYMNTVEMLDEEIDRVEDQVFEDPTSKTLATIFKLKRALLHLRRIIAPQREVINKLARDDYGVIDPESRIYFRDVYDHLVRIYDIIESMRDLTSGALDTYLSVINNRMNEVMKTLTMITTLFMPISFVVGFFGMNFFQPVASLVRWTDQQAFIIAMVIMILTPFGMFIWMRRRAWM